MHLIKPSTLPAFNTSSQEKTCWERDENSNCYSYSLNNMKIKAVSIGCLTRPLNLNIRNLWTSPDGLYECMQHDGLCFVPKHAINENMHLIAVFGIENSYDIPNFHTLRFDGCGTFSAKIGYGIKPVYTGTEIGRKVPMTLDNIIEEMEYHTFSSQKLIWGGFWQIPSKGILVSGDDVELENKKPNALAL